MYASQQMNGGSLGTSAATAIEGAQRQTEVADEIARLSRAIDLFGMTTSQIADRLTPVRRQVGSSTNKNDPTPPEPVLCQVADAIRAQRKQVELFQGLLQQALAELEI